MLKGLPLSAHTLTTVKDVAFSWFCEDAEHCGDEEKTKFKLIFNQQFIRCHRSQAVTPGSFCSCKTNVRVYDKLFMK